MLPVSALEGDNIVDRSERTRWYDGPALLELLETLPAADELEQQLEPLRLPVQLVLRPQGGLAPGIDPAEAERLRDYRAVAGRISGGIVRVGDRVEIFPSAIPATVTGIRAAGAEVQEAATLELRRRLRERRLESNSSAAGDQAQPETCPLCLARAQRPLAAGAVVKDFELRQAGQFVLRSSEPIQFVGQQSFCTRCGRLLDVRLRESDA